MYREVLDGHRSAGATTEAEDYGRQDTTGISGSGGYERETHFAEVRFKGEKDEMFWFESGGGEIAFFVSVLNDMDDGIPDTMFVEYGFVEELPFSMN